MYVYLRKLNRTKLAVLKRIGTFESTRRCKHRTRAALSRPPSRLTANTVFTHTYTYSRIYRTSEYKRFHIVNNFVRTTRDN